ncbi:MAG: MmgE/PrpD family protein [Acidocella sp.]|nr:MmgE/PrpD family protein [Acidocella sp.]
MDVALAALAPFSGADIASVLGRLDPLHAALMNGISSHVFDYDDTHLRTVIHPAAQWRAPCWPMRNISRFRTWISSMR